MLFWRTRSKLQFRAHNAEVGAQGQAGAVGADIRIPRAKLVEGERLE